MYNVTNIKKVLIGVPVAVSCENRTIESIYNLNIPSGVMTGLRIIEGYTVDTARNRIVEEAIAGGWDYVLFVDSDIILPHETLNRLTAVEADIVTGWYIKKMEGHQITELYAPAKEQKEVTMANVLEKDLPKDGSYANITGCGFGCTLVRVATMKAIKEKHGLCFEYQHSAKGLCSEDLDFCKKVTEGGGKILADTALRCGHIGRKVF